MDLRKPGIGDQKQALVLIISSCFDWNLVVDVKSRKFNKMLLLKINVYIKIYGLDNELPLMR